LTTRKFSSTKLCSGNEIASSSKSETSRPRAPLSFSPQDHNYERERSQVHRTQEVKTYRALLIQNNRPNSTCSNSYKFIPLPPRMTPSFVLSHEFLIGLYSPSSKGHLPRRFKSASPHSQRFAEDPNGVGGVGMELGGATIGFRFNAPELKSFRASNIWISARRMTSPSS
jgi:hypothetical protein